jgi:adenine-specific DNA-methyltransferase
MKDGGHHNAGSVHLSRAMKPSSQLKPRSAARRTLLPFRRDVALSYGEASAENILVRGENLDAMRRLVAAGFAGRFRCIYFDPPYNSGRHFAEYDDSLTPAEWRTMMVDRIEVARTLLHDSGTLVVEIDDTELGSLETSLNSIFGRQQRLATVTLVRSAATGHKAQNRGLVNVTDFLLLYAKDRRCWRGNSLNRTRTSHDRAYSSWLENPSDPLDAWRIVPLRAHVGSVLGRRPSRDEIARYALEHAEQVVRFAQPRYEAVSMEARETIDRSLREPHRVLCLERAGRKPLIIRAGNRILFFSGKVAVVEGRRAIVEPLTNVWDDIPFQGIAREGGVRFVRNKKPERLLERIVSLTTDTGDWVLDAFLGSGTTAAVALKMRRSWVGIERGSQVDTMCIPRLRRVIDGADPTGVTRRTGWTGGGGFHVWT